jgi:hypothetical protein
LHGKGLIIGYGAVMSRTQVPLVNDSETTANSPTVDMTAWLVSSVQFVIVNSGLLADSVVPEGETTIMALPAV